MPMSTVGDLRQYLQLSRTGQQLKSDLNGLSKELATGQKSDLTKHLNRQQSDVIALDRNLSLVESFINTNKQNSQLLEVMQLALGGIDEQRDSASTVLIAINDSSTPLQIEQASKVANDSFSAIVQSLNTRFVGKALFGGNMVASNPIANSNDMLDNIRSNLVGLNTAADVSNAIDDWFQSTGGGFETMGYLGDDIAFQERPLSTGQSVKLDMRADDPEIRGVLSDLAKGYFAADQSLNISIENRRELQRDSGVNLVGAASEVSALQARLGFSEGQIETALSHQNAKKTTFSIMRNELVLADPFETATRLTSIENQLETHYTLTARLSRLTLTEYLR